VHAWIAAMKAAGLGVPRIKNACGPLRQILGAAVEHAYPPQRVRWREAA